MEINKFIGELPADFSKPSEKKLNEFRLYISRFTWRNAKTYEQFSPHEYILNFPCWKMKEDGMCKRECEPCKQNREEFEKIGFVYLQVWRAL